MITFGSMFAGIGGIDLGFERCGMQCKWQVENDPYAVKVLEKHWPQVMRHSDVRSFPPKDDNDWSVSVIAAGFPCQDISTAGKKEGLNGSKSALFFEVIRVARQIRPSAIVLENVAALLSRGMAEVLAELAEIGFDAEWHCIPASAVGAPHKRDRVFIIAWRRSLQTKADRTEDGWICKSCNAGIFSGCGCDHGEWHCEDCGEYTYPFHNSRDDGCIHCGSNNLSDPFRKRRRSGYAEWQNAEDAGKRPKSQEHWGWGSEPRVGRVANGVRDRVHRLKCLGNAVVPQVAEVVGEIVFQKLRGKLI